MGRNERSLTLYYREACHLCEDMLQQLHEIQQEHPFDLVQIDVDSDPGLRQRFGALVPVLSGGERILCKYYLDPVALQRYLADSV